MDNPPLSCIFFLDPNQAPQMIPNDQLQLQYHFQQQQKVPQQETHQKTSDCLLFFPPPVPDHYDLINYTSSEDEKHHESSKWMPSKVRLMKKMMVGCPSNTRTTFESSNSVNAPRSDQAIRVCSDCKTTKTPLWRSGPRGPKSLCNACGIRQRKARRAAAAAAPSGDQQDVKKKKVYRARKTHLGDQVVPFKKRCKFSKPDINDDWKRKTPPAAKIPAVEVVDDGGENNPGFRRVFPQDEKEAAILLMALSCG